MFTEDGMQQCSRVAFGLSVASRAAVHDAFGGGAVADLDSTADPAPIVRHCAFFSRISIIIIRICSLSGENLHNPGAQSCMLHAK